MLPCTFVSTNPPCQFVVPSKWCLKFSDQQGFIRRRMNKLPLCNSLWQINLSQAAFCLLLRHWKGGYAIYLFLCHIVLIKTAFGHNGKLIHLLSSCCLEAHYFAFVFIISIHVSWNSSSYNWPMPVFSAWIHNVFCYLTLRQNGEIWSNQFWSVHYNFGRGVY